MSTSTETFLFKGISAAPAAFAVRGGLYTFIATGTLTSAGLSILSADGSTFQAVFTALTAAGVQSPIYLPRGQVQITLTATSANLTLARIPT